MKNTKERTTKNPNKKVGKGNLPTKTLQQMNKDKKINKTLEQIKDRKAKETNRIHTKFKSIIAETS
jgi:hypothetical protein